MSLVLQGASGSSSRVHHTNAILGTVGFAFSAHNRNRREQERELAQDAYGSQDTLNNAGTIAVYKMISPAADILTRLGVDHVIIGFLSILLQILLDCINCFWPVYDCDPVGPHLVQSNSGIIVGIFYIFIGIVSVKIGSFSRNTSGVEVRRRFNTFHMLNCFNFLASFAFLVASSLLVYILWLRLQGCQSVDWSILQVLNFWSSAHAPAPANTTTAIIGGGVPGNVTATVSPHQSSSTRLSSIKNIGQEAFNEDELHAAIICALIVNGFHGMIGTLELLMTLVGFCLRAT